MKLGNTDFQDGCAKDLSFDEFSKTYKGLLKGYDIKLAFKLLGGVTNATTKKKRTTKEDKKVEILTNKIDDKSND